MTAPAVLSAFVEAATRIYPDRKVGPPPPDFVMLAAPEPCEVCGTAVFPARWKDRTELWHIGWEHARGKAKLVQHRSSLCRDAKRRGLRLDGRRLQAARGGKPT